MLQPKESGNTLRRKVLLIAPLDSVHTVRWLSQFSSSTNSFVILPSKKFRKVHPLLVSMIGEHRNYSLGSIFGKLPIRLVGYLDYLFSKLSLKNKTNLKTYWISRAVKSEDFDYIHCLEFQGAGYLVRNLSKNLRNNPKIIVTNWGSDIYFFQNISEHIVKIKQTLNRADFYSGECERDYALATKYGFTGQFLPCIPNAGGFELIDSPYDSSGQISKKTSSRKWVTCKTYGGQFGCGELILQAAENFLQRSNNYNFFFFSVTEDLEEKVVQLKNAFPNHVEFSTRSKGIPRGLLLARFSKSRVYIGASKSDGISTSFLEALTQGAFPIQTNTSCANEWVVKGVIAEIVGVDLHELETALDKALHDDDLVDRAQIENYEIARKHLSYDVIKGQALTFYK